MIDWICNGGRGAASFHAILLSKRTMPVTCMTWHFNNRRRAGNQAVEREVDQLNENGADRALHHACADC
jgi:hypothetical protein